MISFRNALECGWPKLLPLCFPLFHILLDLPDRHDRDPKGQLAADVRDLQVRKFRIRIFASGLPMTN